MITDPAIPRDNGALRLCHTCQRRVYFANGFLRLLAKELTAAARFRFAPAPLDWAAVTPAETEEEAYQAFLKLRWPETDGAPVCPQCGALKIIETSRRRFHCKACARQFSPTTGTSFAYRKMSYRTLLIAIAQFGEPGSALSKAEPVGVAGKTTYSLAHRIRGKSTPTRVVQS